MEKEQVDCGVPQDIKLTNKVYSRDSRGFWVKATAAPSAHRDGVTVFYHEAEHFATEELRLHGTNNLRFQLVTGRRRQHVAGCYIAPIDASIVEDITAAIRARTYGAELLVSGDLNVNITEPEGTPRGEAIADELTAAGLEDMGMHFLPRRKPWL